MPEDILNKTTRCINDFACLSEGWEHCGVVKGLIEGKLLALDVKQMSLRSCNYRVFFGGGSFCTCPTGVEVFKRDKA
jgi:hypothetical protein